MNRALKWKLIAGFLLVFLAGGLTGAFLGASHVRHFFFKHHHRGDISERMRERLRRELDLTPEQVARISPILDRAAAQLQQMRRDTGQRVREILDETHRQIVPTLTDEQRQKLQQIEDRHRRRHRHRGSPEPTSKPLVSPTASPAQNSPTG
jgi:Spy/CpxP family protein refolding chaperone